MTVCHAAASGTRTGERKLEVVSDGGGRMRAVPVRNNFGVLRGGCVRLRTCPPSLALI